MSAMAQMAGTLSGSAFAWRATPNEARPAPNAQSRTGSIRALLQSKGALTAADIAIALEIEGGGARVSALLKNDLRSGRVQRLLGSGPGQYVLSQSFDADLQESLIAAAALLRRNGYTVRRKTP